MRRTLPLALAVLLAAGVATPSLAATKKKPKPIKGSYQASATPDPTSTNPVDNNPCRPNLPGAKNSHPFTIPAAGTLHVELNNKLDWSLAVRDKDGEDEATSDGGMPTDKEMVDVPFKKKQKILIDACNFLGEDSVTVSYTFTYK
jgi:hypothetical protein